MYGKICSPSPPPPDSANEDDDMSLFMRHLLSSSASSSGSGKAKAAPVSDWLVKTLGDDFGRSGDSSALPGTSSPILFSGGLDCCGPASVTRRKGESVELDEFEYESEEGTEVAEESCKPVPPRTGLKRSRAAEVHNLSEKRRRSRINEKMKALQNLIPNSNKTDKASMLDEAIEYLKQLQLQVQMLSMRNGLSLHPMYLPGTIQPLQMSQTRIGMDPGDSTLHMNNMRMSMLLTNVESSVKAPFGLSNQSTSSHQQISLPSMMNMANTETSLGLDLSHTRQSSVQLTTVDKELHAEDMLSRPQLDVSHSAANPSGASHEHILLKKIIAHSEIIRSSCGVAKALPRPLEINLRKGHSAFTLGEGHCLEACLLPPRNPQIILPKDLLDNEIFLQHLQSLHTGRNSPTDDLKSERLDF